MLVAQGGPWGPVSTSHSVVQNDGKLKQPGKYKIMEGLISYRCRDSGHPTRETGLPWWPSGKQHLQCRGHRRLGSIPEWARSPGGGHDNPLQLFLPGEPHGQRSLVGYSPQGHKESDMTKVTEHAHTTSGARENQVCTGFTHAQLLRLQRPPQGQAPFRPFFPQLTFTENLGDTRHWTWPWRQGLCGSYTRQVRRGLSYKSPPQ